MKPWNTLYDLSTINYAVGDLDTDEIATELREKSVSLDKAKLKLALEEIRYCVHVVLLGVNQKRRLWLGKEKINLRKGIQAKQLDQWLGAVFEQAITQNNNRFADIIASFRAHLIRKLKTMDPPEEPILLESHNKNPLDYPKEGLFRYMVQCLKLRESVSANFDENVTWDIALWRLFDLKAQYRGNALYQRLQIDIGGGIAFTEHLVEHYGLDQDTIERLGLPTRRGKSVYESRPKTGKANGAYGAPAEGHREY